MTAMNTVTLGEWSAEDTSVGAVDAALADLRRAEERAAVRTAVLTLVVMAESSDEADVAQDVVHELDQAHPSRSVIVLVERGLARRLDAAVRVHAWQREREGAAICVEDIQLRVGGRVVDHLDSVVEPLALPDLPVAVWFPRRLPDLGDALLRAADRVVVDVRASESLHSLDDLVALTRRLPVVDLSWVRLTPWREVLGGLFEGRDFRPFLDGVQSVSVEGKDGPRHLLAGWLISRLQLSSSRVHLREAERAAMEVLATHDGRRARFAVRRQGDERLIEADVEVEGGPTCHRTIALRERSAARVLGQALSRMGHDRVFEQSVAAASGL